MLHEIQGIKKAPPGQGFIKTVSNAEKVAQLASLASVSSATFAGRGMYPSLITTS